MRQKQRGNALGWEGARVAVPAWHIQEGAFGDGKERSRGELIWLCWRKRLILLLGEEVGRDGEFPAGSVSHPRQTHPLLEGCWVTLCLVFRVSLWERFLSFRRIFGLKACVCMRILGMCLEQVLCEWVFPVLV